MIHSGLHHFALHMVGSVFDAAAPICCHIGALSFVITMTERDMGM
jgi:hypothetical protein